jgi:hypothetical protein
MDLNRIVSRWLAVTQNDLWLVLIVHAFRNPEVCGDSSVQQFRHQVHFPSIERQQGAGYGNCRIYVLGMLSGPPDLMSKWFIRLLDRIIKPRLCLDMNGQPDLKPSTRRGPGSAHSILILPSEFLVGSVPKHIKP